MPSEEIPEHQQPLRNVLSALADRRFLFVRTGGNWGDQLIYLGADFLASQLGLRSRTLYYEQFIKDGAESDEGIYLQGGGGYTLMASGKAPACLRKALQTPGAIVVQGPCTLSDDRHGLEPLQSRSAGNACRPPCVLHYETGSLLRLAASRAAAFGRAISERRHRVLSVPPMSFSEEQGRPSSNRILLRSARTPKRLRRGARPWIAGGIDPAYFARSFDHWIRIHAASKTIVTNRTHSAICGAILGIPTTLFAGAYHKNRSIWEFSLETRGVEWLADIPTPCRPDRRWIHCSMDPACRAFAAAGNSIVSQRE